MCACTYVRLCEWVGVRVCAPVHMYVSMSRVGIQVKLTSSDKPECDQILRTVFNVPAKGVFRFDGDLMLVNGSDVVSVDSGVSRLRSEITKYTEGESRPLFSLDAEWPDKGDCAVALIQVGVPKFALLVRVRVGDMRVKKLPPSLIDILNDKTIDKVCAHMCMSLCV